MAYIFVRGDVKVNLTNHSVGFYQKNPTVDSIYYRRIEGKNLQWFNLLF